MKIKRYKIKIRRINTKIKYSDIIAFLFIIAYLVRGLTAEYESAGFISQVKYIVGMICCAFAMYGTLSIRKKERVFRKELTSILLVVLAFGILSCGYSISSNRFCYRTIQELIFMAFPVLIAYGILNQLSAKKIEKCMSYILYISIICYVIQLGMNFNQLVIAFAGMKFNDSYSALESSSFAGISIALAIYFLYYRSNKLSLVLSVLFVIMTFKRLAVVFVIFLLLFPRITRKDTEINRYLLLLTKLGFVVGTLMVFVLFIPENVTYILNNYGIDLEKFTMTRTYRFNLLYNSNFTSAGLGSTTEYLLSHYGIGLELELIRLRYEVGILGLIIFVNNYFNIVKKNRYCYIVMVYLFLNFLTSHSLADVFGWTIIFTTIGSILYKNEKV